MTLNLLIGKQTTVESSVRKQGSHSRVNNEKKTNNNNGVINGDINNNSATPNTAIIITVSIA